MNKKINKLKKVFGVGVLSGLMLIPVGMGSSSVVEASSKVEKCTLTIDVNQYKDSNYRAYATEPCGDAVMGEVYSPESIWFSSPKLNQQVYGGEVLQTGAGLRMMEVTVKVIPLKGTKPPVNPNPEPEQKPEPEKPKPVTKYFKDVPNSYWASKHINALHEQNIINGYLDNTYRPNTVISRMHVAMLMSRAMELEPIREGKDFKDVPKGHRAYEDVQKLYRAGVIDGKSEDLYGINDNLTRAQMSKIIVKAFDLTPNIYEGSVFPDVSQNHWARQDINTVWMHEIAVGDGGEFKPHNPVSRAQYAAFLHRALEKE